MAAHETSEQSGSGGKTLGYLGVAVALIFMLIGLGIGNYMQSLQTQACDLGVTGVTQPGFPRTTVVVPMDPEACKTLVASSGVFYALFGIAASCMGGVFLSMILIASFFIFGKKNQTVSQSKLEEEAVTRAQHEGPGEPL